MSLPNSPEAKAPGRIRQAASTSKKILDRSRLGLTTLPPEFGQLSSLQSLDLSFNRLTSIPKDLGKLHRLRVLSLQGNQFDTIPSEVAQLKLQSFGISKNPLSSVPPAIVPKLSRQSKPTCGGGELNRLHWFTSKLINSFTGQGFGAASFAARWIGRSLSISERQSG